METKHLIGLVLVLTLAFASVVVMTLAPRLRPWGLFAVAFGGIVSTWMDVNFFGQYWYRGTTRGVEISLLDLIALGLVAAELIAPRYERRRWFWPAGLGLFVLYFGYCIASVATATPKIYGVWELANVLRAASVILMGALMIRTRRELAIVVAALACGVFVEGLYGVKQRFVSGIFRVPGTLDHENTLSTYLCTVGPILLAAALSDWSRWLRWLAGLACAVAAVTELLTISRAGIPIFALGMLGVTFACMTWRITRQKIIIGGLVTLGAGLLLFKTWDQMKARYESASLTDEYLNEENEGRGVYFRWANAIVDDHFFGVGLNNWSYHVSKTYGPRLGYFYEDYDEIQTSPEKADLPSIRYAAPAHSLVAITMGELGIPGLCVLVLVWLRWFQMGARFLFGRLNPDPMRRLGIGILFGTFGCFLHNATEWTYRQTVMLFTLHLMIGVLASLCYARRHAPVPAPVAVEEEEFEIEAEVLPASR